MTQAESPSVSKDTDHGKHYRYSFKGIKFDPYRIFRIYKITDPAQQHAIKKLLRAGQSVKSLEQDIDEVMMTLTRWKEIIEEDREEENLPQLVARSQS